MATAKVFKSGNSQAVRLPKEFRVASDLVRARPDGSMPKWTFAGGTWNDAADPDF